MKPDASARTYGWIVGPHDDLLWIIGGVAVSYLFLLAFGFAGVPGYALVLCWVLLFDGPHIFGTISRTYLDAAERARRGRLLWGSLVLFTVGPLMATVPRLLPEGGNAMQEFWRTQSFTLFVFVASMWAYYHIVMQHYGFLVLYKKKNGDLDARDNVVDKVFLLTTLWAPFVLYMLREPDAVAMWPGAVPGWFAVTMPAAVTAAAAIATIAFMARTLTAIRERRLDAPKLLFLSAVIPMHWAVLTSPLAPFVMVPVLTVSHNIQYQRLVWFHNTNKYREAEQPAGAHGIAAYVSANIQRYYLLGVLFASYRVPHVLLLDRDVAVGFFWGFSLVHYLLDSRIWAVRKDPHLAQPLRLATA